MENQIITQTTRFMEAHLTPPASTEARETAARIAAANTESEFYLKRIRARERGENPDEIAAPITAEQKQRHEFNTAMDREFEARYGKKPAAK
jgi:hypothetical protein